MAAARGTGSVMICVEVQACGIWRASEQEDNAVLYIFHVSQEGCATYMRLQTCDASVQYKERSGAFCRELVTIPCLRADIRCIMLVAAVLCWNCFECREECGEEWCDLIDNAPYFLLSMLPCC